MAAKHINAGFKLEEGAYHDTGPQDEEAKTRCYILELSAELRNKIYEHTLVDDEDAINVDQGYQQPGLLQTCRQIREEARLMWYCQNDFCIKLPDCDPTMAIKFFEFLRKASLLQNVDVQLHPTGKKNWNNLMQWCKAVYEGKVWWCRSRLDHDGPDIGSCAVIASSTWKANCTPFFSSWESLRLSLNIYRPQYGRDVDREWLED